MKARWAPLLAVTIAGVIAGVLGDLLRSESDLTGNDILGGLVLSPFIVTGGGGAVTPRALSPFFVVGGCTFWPIYFLLAVLWIRRGRPWLLAAILFWTAQGFFQIGHRMAVMSGV